MANLLWGVWERRALTIMADSSTNAPRNGVTMTSLAPGNGLADMRADLGESGT